MPTAPPAITEAPSQAALTSMSCSSPSCNPTSDVNLSETLITALAPPVAAAAAPSPTSPVPPVATPIAIPAPTVAVPLTTLAPVCCDLL